MLLLITNSGLIIADNVCPINNTLVSLPTTPKADEELFTINYHAESLINIINFFAAKKNINVVLPQGEYPPKGQNTIDAKVTLKIEKQVTLDEAWRIFNTILEIAGFKLLPKKYFYQIIKITDKINKEPAQIFISTPLEQIPNNDEQIWYVHFLSNIKVTVEGSSEVEVLLKTLLPANSFYADSNTNSLVIMANATTIKGLLPVINKLDQTGLQEQIEKVPLYFSDAKTVAELFNKKIFPAIGGSEPSRSRLEIQRQADIFYFSKSVRIVPDIPANALLLTGRPQAIERIVNFIKAEIDVDIDKGKSPYHIYQLRYLLAENIVPVLKEIISTGTDNATGQSVTESVGRGAQRLFGTVKIITDKPANSQTESISSLTAAASAETDTSIYQGGNRLIIASSEEDWQQLRDIIYQLDQPQKQTLIEVLVADLTIDDTRKLGSLTRNPARIPFPNGVDFQSANVTPGIMPNSFENPQTIGVDTKPVVISSDLLRTFFNSSSGSTDDGTDSVATLAPAGTTVISLNDTSGATWGILQLLKLFDYTKITSHPHIIATHNQESTFEIGESRRVVGAGSLNTTVAAVNIETIKANLLIKLVPRLSTTNEVNLQVAIEISDFRGTSNQIITRKVVTNANMRDGDILALGGLIRSSNSDSVSKTPLLERIPIFGWLFKGRQAVNAKTNVTVFICPTIIKPRLRRGIGNYTRDYVETMKKELDANTLYSTLRDPINSWFFTIDDELRVSNVADNFLLKGSFPDSDDGEITLITENNGNHNPPSTKKEADDKRGESKIKVPSGESFDSDKDQKNALLKTFVQNDKANRKVIGLNSSIRALPLS